MRMEDKNENNRKNYGVEGTEYEKENNTTFYFIKV